MFQICINEHILNQWVKEKYTRKWEQILGEWKKKKKKSPRNTEASDGTQ